MSSSITHYLCPEFSFADFSPSSRVIDVGCGGGRHLAELRTKGCDPVGVEPDAADRAACHRQGFSVFAGQAEHLPFPDGSADGIVCCVVVPYTDERATIAEWRRVLRPGGQARVSYIGFGYAIRCLVGGPRIGRRLYGVRMMVNTWVYRLTGRRLPGKLGDTLYQSERRLRQYYEASGLEVLERLHGRTLLGLPVIMYHVLRRQ
jgi:SAM-dependent methyltransferase